jgi:hypothetical protein
LSRNGDIGAFEHWIEADRCQTFDLPVTFRARDVIG